MIKSVQKQKVGTFRWEGCVFKNNKFHQGVIHKLCNKTKLKSLNQITFLQGSTESNTSEYGL